MHVGMCVGGHTHTCTHNLGFSDGFDDEEEEEEVEEEGEVTEVSEGELEGTAPTPKRRKLARETALSNLGFTLYLEELSVLYQPKCNRVDQYDFNFISV